MFPHPYERGTLDNLTHSLAGAALGQAGLKRLSGLGVTALVIGANLPDVDALATFFGTQALTIRRGWTHGPIALVVLPIVLTLLLVLYDNRQLKRNTRPIDRPEVRPVQLLLLSFLGCLTHPVLDWMNTYGVRLLMPFSDRWFYGDALQIIDPWIWVALLLGVVVSRQRHGSNGARATTPARAALVVVSAYVLLMIAGSRIARTHATTEARARGLEPQRVLAAPVFVNSVRRRIIVDDGRAYTFGVLDLLPERRVSFDTLALERHDDHPFARAALADADVRHFLYWSRYPYFTLPQDSIAGELVLSDARFRDRGGARNFFVVRVPLQRLGSVEHE